MKIIPYIISTLFIVSIISCDETTDTIGQSLTPKTEELNIYTDTLNVASETVLGQNLITQTANGYLGQIKDPETETYTKANFLAQLNTLENYQMVDEKTIVSRDKENKINADSCEIHIYYNKAYGDKNAQINIALYELKKPIKEEILNDYSNFEPIEKQYTRNDISPLRYTYTLNENYIPDSIKKQKSYIPYIRLKLNKEYISKEGEKYNNYGTYIIREYYKNPQNFRNRHKFLKNIIPGLYFKVIGGMGSMAHITAVQLVIFYKHKDKDNKIKTNSTSFISTEEVIQLTQFKTQKDRLLKLIEETKLGYTYLKTPSGLYTQLILPMEEIKNKQNKFKHINTAKITIKGTNYKIKTKYPSQTPRNIIIMPIDSIKPFFSKHKIIDNRTSFLATYNNKNNTYTFYNISSIINLFLKSNNKDKNYGKLAILPVDVYTTTDNNDKTTINKINLNTSIQQK